MKPHVVLGTPTTPTFWVDKDEIIRTTIALRLAHDEMRRVSLHGTAADANQAFVNLGEARRQWHKAVGIQL